MLKIIYERRDSLKVRGLQKLTLLDFPGKTGCTVFLGGCNFRCPFCQNSELIVPSADLYEIPEEEFFAFLKKRQGILDGVAITGGEPLINKGIEEFVKRIKDMGYLVKLDTNGTFPKVLKSLGDKKLIDYVAVDIKNSEEKYAQTVGLQSVNLNPIYESIDYLMNGSIDFEFRTTVVKEFHKKEDFVKIGQWLKGDEKFFLQQYKDSEYVLKKGLTSYSEETMHEFCETLKLYIPKADVRGIE